MRIYPRFIIFFLVLTGCQSTIQSSPVEQLALQMRNAPGVAMVIGTISQENGGGFLGRYPSHAFLRFESDGFIQSGGGKRTPLSFLMGKSTYITPQRYVLKDFIDGVGRAYTIEGMKFGRPVLLDLYPGEIVYIGDIHFKIDTNGQLRATVEDHWQDYVQSRSLSPATQARITKRLLLIPPILPIVKTSWQDIYN